MHAGNLLKKHVSLQGGCLRIADTELALADFDKLYVLGAGKAAAAMAAALEEMLGERITTGVIAVKYGHQLALEHIRCMEAAHPVPDENSVAAGEAVLNLARKAGQRDLVLCLFSGGASALLNDVPPGASLQDVQQLFGDLLYSGADIGETNQVRKHISFIKGGQLARAIHPARFITLLLSDVPGNDPAVIGSGPTLPDATTFREAVAVLDKYNLWKTLSPALRMHLEKGLKGMIAENPLPDDPVFHAASSVLIGSNRQALGLAAEEAQRQGYRPVILEKTIEGDVQQAAIEFFREALRWRGRGPVCLLAGGETTVQVKGQGKGGRCQELALHLTCLLKDMPGIAFLCAGTDGQDGNTPVAGCMTDHETWEQSRQLGLDPESFIRENDSYTFFLQTGDHLHTGPTHTNVMDLLMALIA